MNIFVILLLPGALLTSKALSSAAVINCVAQFVVFVVTAQVIPSIVLFEPYHFSGNF